MDNSLIYGLIFNCPFEKSESDCPFIQLREMSVDERISYISRLTARQRLNLVRHHKKCLKRREADRKNKIK